MTFRAYSPRITRADLARVGTLLDGCAHYKAQNRHLFAAGYLTLLERVRPGMQVLEIGCGSGEFSNAFARAFPQTQLVATDVDAWPVNRCRELYPNLPNVRFELADAHQLSQFAPESFDLVLATAALHHLANNVVGASKAAARVLKPGGGCLFIFEPLGHNVFVAALRAALCSIYELVDESNLYFSTLQRFGENFSRVEVQCFNLVGYAAKLLPSKLYPNALGSAVEAVDHACFSAVPWLLRQAGNCNVLFIK